MALTINLITGILLLGQLSLLSALHFAQKPTIDSPSEQIIDAYDNFTLLCQGNAPLIWQYNDHFDNEEFIQWTKVQTTHVMPQDEKYKYANRIFITNASFPYTGFYRCYEKHADPSNETQVAQMYLFVKDEEHLSVSENYMLPLVAAQFSNITIPCRPTSPEVTVELIRIEEKVENAIYNPKTGFQIQLQTITDNDLLYCKYTRGDLEQEEQFIIIGASYVEHLEEPELVDESEGHTIVGGNLTLTCTVRGPGLVTISWETPKGKLDLIQNSNVILSDLQRAVNDQFQSLIITNTQRDDAGVYYCNVSDIHSNFNYQTLNVSIYDVNVTFIELFEENNITSIETKVGQTAIWNIMVKAHPRVSFSWFDDRGNEILDSNSNYITSFTSNSATLEVKDVNMSNYGNYTFRAFNNYSSKSLNLFLSVTDPPIINIGMEKYYYKNTLNRINCTTAGSPRPSISWYHSECSDCGFKSIKEASSKSYGQHKLRWTSFVDINTTKSGTIRCLARNSLGADEETRNFVITDVDNGFDIFGLDSSIYHNKTRGTATAAFGAPLKMVCGATVNENDSILWFHNDELIYHDLNSIGYTIQKSTTDFSQRSTLSLEKLDFADGGKYSCQVTENGKIKWKNITLNVKNASPPVIKSTDLLNDLQRKLPGPLNISCIATGIPKPQISWFKNNEPIQTNGRIYTDGSYLKFKETESSDEGSYRCVSTNTQGSKSQEAQLTFTNKPKSLPIGIIIGVFVFLIILVIIAVVIIITKNRKEAKLRRELEIVGLQNFISGAIESLNPDLGLDDQAELLPYNENWEFPIEHLKLGKQLGAGAFGVVIKGVAKRILEDEERTTVAVKMVKKNSDHMYLKALVSELKIMIHLGKHLNVVNLLGACTKSVAKRQLLVIVEYCRFGNLQNYLLRHREHFINQLDETNGNIDYSIGEELLQRTYSMASNQSTPQSPLKYAADACAAMEDSGYKSNMDDYPGKNASVNTALTDTTVVSMSPNSEEDGIILSNGSIQPEWRSNYHGDYKDNVKPISTKDLLAWAYQVSRGMDYLASRKVLHGDLAARNILLSDNNVVKICDFGLAKSMYKDDNYKKKGDVLLPLKWMAIESIRDRIFSTQSDVWSFGIVLWEFFSLAMSPYPGMEANEHLYLKLLDGYRMESPMYAPKSIYKMMLDCWSAKPLDRPSFPRLSDRIGSLLEDTVRKHYIELNDPYLLMNTKKLESGEDDYLEMLNSPNFDNIVSPRYVNELKMTPPVTPVSGYLSMESNVFSPRNKEQIFDFNIPKNTSVDEGLGYELRPMLTSTNESDCESNCNSPPIIGNSVENPSYHVPPVIVQQKDKTKAELVKIPEHNYVNIHNHIFASS